MINKFTEKGIVQKIIIALIVLIVFNFVYPYIPAFAAEASESSSSSSSSSVSTVLEGVGGVLLEPLIKLITTIAEGIIWVLQTMLLNVPSNVHINSEGEKMNLLATAAAVVGATAATIIGLVAAPFTLGASAAIGVTAAAALVAGIITYNVADKMIPDDWYFPLYYISPEDIFANQIPALNINFINPPTYAAESNSNDKVTVFNSAKQLGPVVSKWYTAIRNMVIVGLMIVLLYIGIRIIISAAADEKAKYKENLKDWLIAVILVVFMHYIMAFALTITDYLTNMLITKQSVIDYHFTEDVMKEVFGDEDISKLANGDGTYTVYTNLMGHARLKQQLGSLDEDGNVIFNWDYIGYAIIYMVMVIYSVMFLVIYLKRVVYMAFLTMIAPLVALTYPLDKISDGKAQAFDMWLKEYIYNLLIQPFHLLIYTVLIGSAMDLASNNMLYALVVLGFLTQAEQILRRFFGFEKAPGMRSWAGDMVAGQLTMDALRKVGKIGPPPPPKGGRPANVRTSDSNKVNLAARSAEGDYKDKSNNQIYMDAFGSGELGSDDEEQAEGLGAGSTVGTIVGGIAGNNGYSAVSTSNDGDEGNLDINRDHINLVNPPDDEELPKGQVMTEGGLVIPASVANDINGTDVQIESNEEKAARENIPQGEDNTIRLTDRVSGTQNDDLSVTPTIQSETRPKRRIKRVIHSKPARTAGAIAKTGIKYTGKALKNAPRLVAKGATGAAVGTIGVAAGIASGDLKNVGVYGATAAKVGASMADTAITTGERVGQGIVQGANNFKSDVQSELYSGDELKKRQNERADEEWRKNKDVIKAYRNKYGSEKVQYTDGQNNTRTMKNYEAKMLEAEEFRKAGVTDDKIIMSSMGLKNANRKEQIATAKAATSISNAKGVNEFGQRLSKLGIPDDKVNEVKNNLMDVLDL